MQCLQHLSGRELAGCSLGVPGSLFEGKSSCSNSSSGAAIAQLGERQTEDLKDPGSIPGLGTGKTATGWCEDAASCEDVSLVDADRQMAELARFRRHWCSQEC